MRVFCWIRSIKAEPSAFGYANVNSFVLFTVNSFVLFTAGPQPAMVNSFVLFTANCNPQFVLLVKQLAASKQDGFWHRLNLSTRL